MDFELLPPVLIADDGELDDVRRVLDQLEIDFVEVGDGQPSRCSLLITSARRALTRLSGGTTSWEGLGRLHIVVSDKTSRTMWQELQRLRPDFLLQRPVDPEALRLLVLHALYGGPERRRALRAVMCAVVRFRTGLIARKATLADLSQRGCRLISERKLEPGEELTVTLPRELTGSRSICLRGAVVATAGAGDGEPGRFSASVAFRPFDIKTAKLLRTVMARHAVGSALLRPRTELEPDATRIESPTDSGEDSGATPAGVRERRTSPRKLFERSVLAAGKDGAHVLVGCDLSSGGMRVSGHPELAVGDEFNLVVRGPANAPPALVKAIVARDDGEDGCILRFGDVSEANRAALEEIVASLPSLEGAGMDAIPQPNVIVSEIVSRR